MNVYLAGGCTRPYVFMDLFLAGGITGNICKQWKLLASKIIEECKSISQEKTANGVSLEHCGGGYYEPLFSRRTSGEERHNSRTEGGNILSLNHTIIAGVKTLFQCLFRG